MSHNHVDPAAVGPRSDWPGVQWAADEAFVAQPDSTRRASTATDAAETTRLLGVTAPTVDDTRPVGDTGG